MLSLTHCGRIRQDTLYSTEKILSRFRLSYRILQAAFVLRVLFGLCRMVSPQGIFLL